MLIADAWYILSIWRYSEEQADEEGKKRIAEKKKNGIQMICYEKKNKK